MAQSSSSTAIQHRGPGIKLYLVIAAALLVLTVITVLVSFVNLGGFNVVIALGIASIKAMLVALFSCIYIMMIKSIWSFSSRPWPF